MRLPDPAHSHVVLIGTSKYADEKLPDLSAVARTITAVQAALTDPAHGLVPAERCSVMLDEGDLRLIGRRLRQAASSAEDLLLVYYSGHGLIGGRRHELYLGLHDSEWAEPDFNSLEYEKLRNAVLASPADTKLIVLDCCFSGRAVSGTMTDAVSEAIGQAEVDGTYVLTAAAPNEVALILPGEELTAFSGRLLNILREGVPGAPELLSVDRVFRELRRVMRAEGLPQPQNSGTQLAGLLALARNRAYKPRNAGDPAVRLGTVRELRRLLFGDNLTIAASTCPVLAQYADDRSREVAEAASKALHDARIQPDPATIDFGRVQQGSASPRRTVRLLGPPIARVCEPQLSHDWILLERAGESVGISLDTAESGILQGTITLEGPASTAEISIYADVVTASSAPVQAASPRPPVPDVSGDSRPSAASSAVSPEQERTPEERVPEEPVPEELIPRALPDAVPPSPPRSLLGLSREITAAQKSKISFITVGVAAAAIGTAIWQAIPGPAASGPAAPGAAKASACTVYSGSGDGFNKPAGIASDPLSTAVGKRHLWVANFGGNSVTELNSGNGKVVQVLSGQRYGFNQPAGIASDGKDVWVTNSAGNSVTELNAIDGSFVNAFKGSPYRFSDPGAITSDGSHVWVANYASGANSVTEFDASDPSSVSFISSGVFKFANPSGIAVEGNNRVWVSNSGSPSWSEFNYPAGQFIRHEYLGDNSDGAGPTGITYDGKHIWAVDGDETVAPSFVAEYDPSDGSKVGNVSGKQYKFWFPEGVTSGDGHVWIANDGNNTVTELNSSTGGLAHIFSGGSCSFNFNQSGVNSPGGGVSYTLPTPTPITFDGTNTWAANYGGNSVTRINLRASEG